MRGKTPVRVRLPAEREIGSAWETANGKTRNVRTKKQTDDSKEADDKRLSFRSLLMSVCFAFIALSCRFFIERPPRSLSALCLVSLSDKGKFRQGRFGRCCLCRSSLKTSPAP